MGLMRKVTSVSTGGAVKYTSNKEKARANERAANKIAAKASARANAVAEQAVASADQIARAQFIAEHGKSPEQVTREVEQAEAQERQATKELEAAARKAKLEQRENEKEADRCGLTEKEYREASVRMNVWTADSEAKRLTRASEKKPKDTKLAEKAGRAVEHARVIRARHDAIVARKEQRKEERKNGTTPEAELPVTVTDQEVEAEPSKETTAEATLAEQPSSPAPVETPNENSLAAQLVQLAQMKESGLLTDEEFAAAKAKLLS